MSYRLPLIFALRVLVCLLFDVLLVSRDRIHPAHACVVHSLHYIL